MPSSTAIKLVTKRKRLSPPARQKASRRGTYAHDSIPASFLAGMKDIAEGRFVEMDKALNEPHPGQKI